MKTLKTVVEELTGAFYEEAKEKAEYPYKVLSLKRIADTEGKQTYTLEINVWDRHPYYSRAESIMDKLEKELDGGSWLEEIGLIRIFKGQRQNVPDPDRAIKRVREQFELHFWERRN